MSGTPLTDAINSLIVLANETTGKSDTTLSDAVESLIDGYGGGSVAYYTISYYNGETLLDTETVQSGDDGTYTGATPTKSSTVQYTYAFAGWSKDTDDGTVDSDALTHVVGDRNVYACFTGTTRTYTVYWVNNGTTIETDTNVPYGTVPHYDGSTPTKDGQTSVGWLPDPTQPITGDTTFTAQYPTTYTVTFKNDTGSTTLDTQIVAQGGTAVYGGSTPTSSTDSTLSFLGWATSANAHQANAVLTNVQSNMTVYAAFEAGVEVAEISDSWDTIIANIDNGTYATKYKLGNYKPLDLGTEGIINMQIVAMDADELASGGTAPLTFLGMELLNSKRAINSTTDVAGGWANASLRSVLMNDIYPLIPSNVSSRINRVNKTCLEYISNGEYLTHTTNELLWIPSTRELQGSGGDSANDITENNGVSYTNTIFPTASSRIKSISGTNSEYWTRSVGKNIFNGKPFFINIGTTGGRTTSTSTKEYGVCLGFCLGLEPETITDDWSTILANTNYATDYSIGDTKYIDLGTEGKHLMEIVGIDVDDRADGTGKAGLTWISKNAKFTKNGRYIRGSEKSIQLPSELESIENDMQSNIRSNIVPVTKSTLMDGTISDSSMTVWSPSFREIRGIEYPENWEKTGPIYSERFPDATSRIKYIVGKSASTPFNSRTAVCWTARTNRNGIIRTDGATANGSEATNTYVVFGFCTN